MTNKCEHKKLEYQGWGMFKGAEGIPPMPVAYHYKCKACGSNFMTGIYRGGNPSFEDWLLKNQDEVRTL